MKGAPFLVSGLLALVLMSTKIEGKATRDYEDVRRHESDFKKQQSDGGDTDDTVSEVESEDHELVDVGSMDDSSSETFTSHFAGRGGRFPFEHKSKPSVNRSKNRGPGRGRFPVTSSRKPVKSSPEPNKHQGTGTGRFPIKISGKPAKSSPESNKHQGTGTGRFPIKISGKPAKSSPESNKHQGTGTGRFPVTISGKPAKSSPEPKKHRGPGRGGRFPNGKR